MTVGLVPQRINTTRVGRGNQLYRALRLVTGNFSRDSKAVAMVGTESFLYTLFLTKIIPILFWRKL